MTVEDVDSLIDALTNGPANHNLAQLHSLDRSKLPSGYPDHELMVGVNRKLPNGLLAFMGDDTGTLFTAGDSGNSEEILEHYFLVGHQMEYPGRSEIPIEIVRKAVKEFLLSGGLKPISVEWKTSRWW